MSSNHLNAQKLNLGTPPIENYDKGQYSAGNQNWASMHHNGRLYFANDGGLLIYDGVKWNTLPTPNNTVMRSIANDGDTKICIGAQGELGCFEPDEYGELVYSSILEELSINPSDIEEVWQIEFIDNKLYAHIRQSEILMFHNGESKLLKTSSEIIDMVKVNDEIYIHVDQEGLNKILDDKIVSLNGTNALKDYDVVDMFAFANGVLIMTAHNGLYYYENGQLEKWKTNADDFLKDNQARCGLQLENGALLIGTHLGGIVRIGKDKRANLILDKKHGLQSNAINDMSLTLDGNLWVASIGGIDRIDLESTYEVFYPDGDLEGGVYDIEFWNNQIYFCTSNGIYSIKEKEYYNPFIELDFKLVIGTRGQSYNLDVINNELFCCQHRGAYRIKKDNSLDPILEEVGAWKFVKLGQNKLALGTYEGVFILERSANDKWIVNHKVQGLQESSRVMLMDKFGYLWVSHPYKNVYRIAFSDDFNHSTLKVYDKADGFQSNNRNYIFPYKGECLLTNGTGVYQYNADSDIFDKASKFEPIYPEGVHVRNILAIDDEIWVISDVGTDKLLVSDTDVDQFELNRLITGRTDEHYIGGFENLCPLDSNTILMCTEKGVKLFQGHETKFRESPPMITSVSLPAYGDSLIYGGFGSYPGFKLDNKTHDINFEFTAPNALKPTQYYRYMLEGFDKDWSDWTSSQTKEYSNLDYGSYAFYVRTVNQDNSESIATQVNFTISTPWYKTWVAYLVYSLLFLGFLLSILLIPRSKYKQTTAKLAAEKEQTEVDLVNVKKQRERDLEKIRREKLESEIAFKNKELAMSTMYLLQKNETLDAIRSEVENVEKSIVDAKAKKELRKVANLLRSDTQLENEWQNFSIHFDQVHHNFLKRLKSSYPKLTPNDQKLSAYLRMNLTTKEIAPLLKISVRGVEISRYRLRKKLELTKDVNLNDFMMTF